MSESGATEREPDPTSERLAQRGGAGEPDVLLDIPAVTVDQIRLAVDGLDADLSLRARLANLLQLDAGVRVHLQGVELDVTGVSAEALLKVRLEKVLAILDRALSTIDRNPQLIEALARTVETSVDDVNRTAQQLTGGARPLIDQLGQQVGAVGAVADQALRQGVDQATQGPSAPSGAQPPEPPTGPAGEQQPGRPAGGRAEPSPGAPAAGKPEPGPGGGAGQPSGGAGPSGEPTGGAQPGQPTGGGQPGPAEGGAAAGKAPGGRPGGGGAAQLAGQAGETLRQAGRSVWEAIQGGMGQNRQQRPKR